MHRDRLQITVRIIGHAGEEVLIDGPATHRDGGHGVAIRCGLSQRIGAYIAASAGAVLDEEILAEPGLQLLGQQPGEHIGRATGRPGHDDAHRALGPLALGGGYGWQGQAGGQDMAAVHHCVSFPVAADRAMRWVSGQAVR